MARTILIVDDNAIDRSVLRGFLENDYEVIEATNAEEMVSVLRQREKTLSAILLDIVMPGTDGFDALREIRNNANYRQVPVIVISGQNDEKTQARALALGAAGFTSKPYNSDIILPLLENTIRLREKSAIVNSINMDALTGMLNRKAFFQLAAECIKLHTAGYYVLSCFDIENFKVINDQYGIENGDRILRRIAGNTSRVMQLIGGICCHDAADKFGMLYPASYMDSDEIKRLHGVVMTTECTSHNIRIRVGRYRVDDLTLPVSAMYDRATIAEESIKGRYDTYIAEYTDEMRQSLVNEQRVVNDMVRALEAGEFEPWFQPQYNHATGALIGAETLVRWRKDGRIITPNEFIGIFERNGFIYEMDQYIWRSVCILLHRWLTEDKKPLPVSINISRFDLLQKDFMEKICALTEEYELPPDLLRLEVTESAFTDSTKAIYAVVNELIKKGFTVEIDDFGSGYSSLNTLKDVPASILKLDMLFFEQTGDARRGGNIVESVVRMAKWLGMAVIAEGVEDRAQADYLKSIGCIYIQGFFYARPIPAEEYERLLLSSSKETKLNHLQTLQDLDNNEFWDSHSMDTFIFNSFVGSACILELYNGKVEMLRATEHYAHMLSGGSLGIKDVIAIDWMEHMDEANICLFTNSVGESIRTKETVTREFEFHGLPGCRETVVLRCNLRVIATAGERSLIYCLSENITAQRDAERAARNASERVNAVMNNSHCGISAVIARQDGTVEFLFANNRFFELQGYTREQYAAEVKNPYENVLPQDREMVFDTVTKLTEIGSTASLQMQSVRRDGSVLWMRCDISIVKFEDIPEHVQLSSFIDITVQKESELKQLESARQLEIIMANISGGISAICMNGDKPRFIIANEQYYKLAGYTKAECEAENIDPFDLVHPDDRERVLCKFIESQEYGESYTLEYRMISREGKARHILCNANVIRMLGVDKPVQLVVSNDITGMREMQRKELALSAQLQTIMKNIHGGITATLFHDKNNIEIVFSNDGFYEMYGYTREQMESEVPNMLDLIFPEDRERTMETVARIAREHGSETYEYRCRKRDGGTVWVQCTNSVFSLEGVGDTVLLAVTTDVSELRTSQQEQLAVTDRLHAVMNAMSNGMTAVVFHDERTEFLFANNRYYEMHGIHRGDIGEEHLSDAINLLVPKFRDKMRDAIIKAAKTGQTASCEYQIQRPDGVIRWLHASISMTRLADVDDPVQVAVFSDITAEKEASDQLHFLNDSARDILAQSDSEQAIRDTLTNLVTYFFADRGFVTELDEERMVSSNTYEVCADGVRPEIDILQAIPYRKTDGWYDRLSRSEYYIVKDVMALDDSQAALRRMLFSHGIRSAIIAPLLRDGRLIGFAGVDNPRRSFHQNIEQMGVLTDYMIVLLTRRDLIRKIRHDAQTVQQLMDDTPGGFLRLAIYPDRDPVIESFNDGFCHMLRMTREEVLDVYGKDSLLCFAPEDIGRTATDIAAAQAVCGEYTGKTRLRQKDGQLLWVMLFGRFVRDENGKLFLNAYFTDIAQEQTTEENQKALLDNLPFGAAMYGYDGERLTVFHINRKYWKLVDREATEYENTSVTEAIHPEDRILTMQEVRAAVRQGRSIAVDIRILCGNGSYSPFHITASVVPQKDGKYRLFAAYSPISNEAISLQEILPIAMSTIMETSDDISYIKGKDLHFIACSKALADIAGQASNKDVIGKNAYDLFERKLAEKFTEDDRKIIETGKPAIDVIEHLPTAQGTTTVARTSKYPIRDAAGDVIGVYCISHDVTARLRRDSQLDLMNRNIPGGLASFSLTNDGYKALYFNDNFFAFLGYTREEYTAIIEKTPLALVLEEDREKLRDMLRTFTVKRQDGMTGTCDYRCHTKDAKTRYMSLKAVLKQIDTDKFILNVLQFDMTQHVEVEQRMENLLDNLPFGAAMYEFDGEHLKPIHINRQYRKIVGHMKIDDLYEDASPMNFIHPDDRSITLREIKDSIRNHRDGSCNIRVLVGEGEYRSLHVDARIVSQPDGKYIVYASYTRLSEQELTFENALPHIFSTIMESSTDLAFAKDINFRYICCSKTFATLLGLESEKQVIGKTDYELFPKDIADMFRRDDSSLLATAKPQIDIQEMLPSPDGTKHYIRTSKHLMRNSTDTIIGIYCIGRDVTEIREAYAQLRLLTDSIPGGIATLRCYNGNIEPIYFNDGICSLAGYTREEYIEEPVPLLDFVLEEDRQNVRDKIKLLESGEMHLNITFRIYTKNGGYKWINSVVTVSDHVGDVYEVNTVLTDVTEQQEEKERLRLAEEEYRIAISHSGHTIGRYDIAERTLTISDDASAKLALPETIADVPYGLVKLGKISKPTAKEYIAFYEKIMHGEKECTVTFQKLFPNGWRWIKERATTIFDDDGKPVSAIVSYSDVTDQQEKEAVYNKWQQNLMQKGPETYTLYRCNLNQNAGYDTVEGKLLNTHESWNESEAKTFNERTRDFCMSCVVADDREMYLRFVNSDTMLANYYRGKRSAGIEFRGHIASGEIHWIRLSAELVEYPNTKDVAAYLMYEDINDSKLMALETKTMAETDPLTGLLNRKTFIARMDKMLSMRKENTLYALLLLDVDGFKLINDSFGHAAGDQMLIDTGRAIQSVLRESDLVCRMGGDEFLICMSAVPNKDIIHKKVKLILDMMHNIGKVEVKLSVSAGIAICPDDGNTFETLYHKADKALYHVKSHGKDDCAFYNANMETVLISTDEHLVTPIDPKVKPTMLIVDDNKVNQKLMSNVFATDFNVETAYNGASALSYIRNNANDVAVVLLELTLPDMNGLTVLEHMQEIESSANIPVVAVSSVDEREAALRVIRAGASDFVTQPVDPTLLRIRVESAIAKAENERLRAQNRFLALLKSREK